MKKTGLIFSILLIFVSVAMSMSDCSEDDITIPDENFEVEITDIDGVVTKGKNITFESQIYFTAERGSTTIFVPFERLKEIKMLNGNEVITKKLSMIDMQITLIDESVYDSKGSSHQEITGEADFGKFRIRLDHIQIIKFLPMKKSDESPDQKTTIDPETD